MTPLEALECRDRLTEIRFGDDPDSVRLSAEITVQVSQAQVLIWQPDIWAAAQQGWKTFVGQPAEELAALPPQLWFLDERWSSPGHPWCGLGAAYPELKWLTGVILRQFQPLRARAPRMSLLPFCWKRGPGPRQGELSTVGAGTLALDGSFDELHAPLGAAVHFLALDFIGKEPVSFPRHVRRAAEMKRRPALPEVNTVVLRRSYRNGDREHVSGEPIEWSCSFIRCGHWQNHWWPREKIHKPTYIMPQLRGDPGKPLHYPQGIVYDARR